MKKNLTIVLTCSLAALACGVAFSQPEKGKPDPAAAMKKQMAAMMLQKGQPTAEHKLLEPLAGEFDSEFAMIMGPGMSLTAKGTMTGKMVLGGRFLEVHSTPAADEDFKIESLSYLGYDARHKKYFWWGIDSTDTYSVFAEGDFDAATKTFTLLGENEEPGLGKVPFKTILRVTDADHSTMQIWFKVKDAPGADADGWFKVAEINKSRKKK